MNQLDQQTVLVIGGGKNLGRAIAERAAELGATVIVGSRSGQDASPGARAIRVDVTDESSIAEAAGALGPLDHVVVTAAAHHNVPVRELDHDATVRAFEAKVVGPMLVAKHFDVTGSITLFSGVAAWRPAVGYSVMGITNGAVSFAAAHLARELAPVRVNAVSPGIVDSGSWDQMSAADRAAFFDQSAQGTLAGRVGRPEDIVAAVEWLLSAGFVSGETIHVEGGARWA